MNYHFTGQVDSHLKLGEYRLVNGQTHTRRDANGRMDNSSTYLANSSTADCCCWSVTVLETR